LVLAFALMAPDFGQQQPAHVLRAHGPHNLLTEGNDLDTQMFESEGHVQTRAIAIRPREKAVRVFVNFLTELATQDAQFSAALDAQSFHQAAASEDE
jgi:hypothetical protein